MTNLIDDVNAVVKLLPLEDGVEKVEPVLEVGLPVPEGDDYGHLLLGDAVCGTPATAKLESRVLRPYVV